MKKLILSAAALFAFGFANAQDATTTTGGKGFSNGDVFISGRVGISSQSTGEVKNSTFSIAPQLGFFVSDNIAIGAMIGYEGTTQEDGIDPDEYKTSTFVVGGFARYYATPASDFSFFGELGIEYAMGKEEQGAAENKINGFGIGLRPAVSYFISDNFALEASFGQLSYSSVKPDNDAPIEPDSTDTFDFNIDLTNITFGLVYKF